MFNQKRHPEVDRFIKSEEEYSNLKKNFIYLLQQKTLAIMIEDISAITAEQIEYLNQTVFAEGHLHKGKIKPISFQGKIDIEIALEKECKKLRSIENWHLFYEKWVAFNLLKQHRNPRTDALLNHTTSALEFNLIYKLRLIGASLFRKKIKSLDTLEQLIRFYNEIHQLAFFQREEEGFP